MSLVYLIDELTEWARLNVCEKIKLKVPPANEVEAVDEGYAYELATPAAFAMYTPTSEKLPPGIHSPFPSLCVRFISGEDDPASGSGFVEVQFCFSAWDPGIHGKDILVPAERGCLQWKAEESSAFRRNAEGWRDAWNFVDIALRAVESVTAIGRYPIDRSTPIKFGPLTEQEAISDLYPYWFAWMQFRVNYPLVRNNEEFQNFL